MSAAVSSLLLAIPAASAGGSDLRAVVGKPAASSAAPKPGDLERTARKPCSAHRAVTFYARRIAEHRARMGASEAKARANQARGCPRYLAHVLKRKARAWRLRADRWVAYHYDWRSWLPAKWQRIGACETGYGRRPGDWRWNSGTYEGAFGFYHGSWDAFVPHADPKAGPYPHAAYLATPRQQYEVALAIWRRFGFSGWGCRAA